MAVGKYVFYSWTTIASMAQHLAMLCQRDHGETVLVLLVPAVFATDKQIFYPSFVSTFFVALRNMQCSLES